MKRILTLLVTSILLASSAVAQQNLLKVRINDFSGGMASNSLADILQPNQGASLTNVSLSRPGILETRGGQGLFLKDVGSTAFTGLGRFDPDAITSYLVAASGTQIIRATSTADEWTIANPASPQTSGKDTEFIQANDLLFVLNGIDSTSWYNGSAWYKAGVYPPSPPSATTGAWLRNYLFLAGATTESDWLYFSNNLEPDKFDASDIIKINTGDGQAIQRVMPFRQNELIVYKERSIFVVDITGDTVPDDWTVQPISDVVGTIAPRSVVNLGNDHWFLSSNPIAIRSLARSEFDKILLGFVSRPIQDVFDGTGLLTVNESEIDKAAAVLFDNKFLLAIPTGTSEVNNTVLVYDFIVQSWYLITGWFPSDWIKFDERLFYIDANDGRVIECFTATYADWEEGPNFIDSASSPTVGIDYTYMSRVLDFDNPENFKQADALEVEFDPTGDWDVNVFINLDSEGWQKVGTVNVAGNTQTLNLTLPFVLRNEGVARKTFHLTKYGEFKKMQVMVQHRASGQNVSLQRMTIFGQDKGWRRE